MSQLDDLLARSRAPGRFVERRRFTLSRDKAIEKLREFSLRDPRQYVLELVQSAVFAGATYIAADVSADRMLFAWVGGRTIRGAELHAIFDYLFAGSTARDRRHLTQLAIGLNALLQRRPSELRVESGDGTHDGTVRMDLDQRGDGVVGTPAEPLAGTYVLARFGSGWFERFRAGGATPEAALIEERCRFAPVPILLDGRAPFGYKACRAVRIFGEERSTSFEEDGRRGAIAVPNSRSQAKGFQIVVGGVCITTMPIPELGRDPGGPDRLVGVICDDGLRKTADQSDIVRDHAFERMLQAVQPHATALIRKSAGARYQAPSLPAIAEASPDTSEPLPSELPQVGPRPDLSMEGLERMRPGDPLFRTRPEDEAALVDATDPTRFPFPVLVLTDGQVETLDRRLPGLAVHRLGSPADVDFVRRALERHRVAVEREIPFRSEVDPSIGGRLRLRLTVAGPLPCWGDPTDGDVPILVAHAGRSVFADHVPLGLPGVCAVFVADGSVSALSGPVVTELGEAVLDHAWRLVPAPEEVAAVSRDAAGAERVEAAVRALASGLLAAFARPGFVRAVPGGPAELRVALPPDWGPEALRLAALPLVSTDRGPLSLDALVALQGTREAAEVADTEPLPPEVPARCANSNFASGLPEAVAGWKGGLGGKPMVSPPWDAGDARTASLRAIEPLEERLGYGHLGHPSLYRPLSVVARTPMGWAWWGQRDPQDGQTAVLWLGATVPARADLPGWEAFDTGIAAVGAAVRPGTAVPDMARDADWLAGLSMLWRGLARIQVQGDWSEVVGEGVGEARARALVRLGVLSVAGFLGRVRRAPVLTPLGATTGRDLESLLAEPGFAVAAANGVVHGGCTLLLTLDELRALEESGGGAVREPLPLRVDDPPEVWRSLHDPGARGWLLRQRVRIPGMTGWLGLREPHDDSTGVLSYANGRVVAISEIDRAVPCHGILRMASGSPEPSRAQVELLRLAREQLYQQVLDLLGRSPGPEAGAAASAYAMAYAHASWCETGGRLSGIAAALARAVLVAGPDGQPWGTMARWLESPPERRPALPIRLRTVLPAHATDPRAARAEHGAFLSDLRARLLAALAEAGGGIEFDVQTDYLRDGDAIVRADERWTSPGRLCLVVNLAHAVGYRIAEGDALARELILLEMARLAARHARKAGWTMDLAQAQQVLLAQRMGG